MNKRKFLGSLGKNQLENDIEDLSNLKLLIDKNIVVKGDYLEYGKHSFVHYVDGEFDSFYYYSTEFIDEIFESFKCLNEKDKINFLFNLVNEKIEWLDIEQRFKMTIDPNDKKKLALEYYKRINENSLNISLKSLYRENSFKTLTRSNYPIRRLYFKFINREKNNEWKSWVFDILKSSDFLKHYLVFDESRYQINSKSVHNIRVKFHFEHDVDLEYLYLEDTLYSADFRGFKFNFLWKNFYSLSRINEFLKEIIDDNEQKSKLSKERSLEEIFNNKNDYSDFIKSMIKEGIINENSTLIIEYDDDLKLMSAICFYLLKSSKLKKTSQKEICVAISKEFDIELRESTYSTHKNKIFNKFFPDKIADEQHLDRLYYVAKTTLNVKF